MNTSKKGDLFENKVFRMLKSLLDKGELGLNPMSCKIIQKAKYDSPLREKNIIVDIAIEVFAGKNEKPIMIWIIECKDYTHPVPVDDIEEFDRKVTQIMGLNTKAIFVSSNSFQKGAFTFAKNRNIALIRILSENQVSWFLNFCGSENKHLLDIKQFEGALSNENYKAINRDFFAYGKDKIYGDWNALFRNF